MKKIFVLIAVCAISLSSANVFAQQTEEELPVTKTYADQGDYKKIHTDKLSEIIKAAVEKDFPEATISEAYTDKKGNCKLILTINNTTKTVYANSRGEWFTPEE